ncbi:MAG: molybdopterin-binding protein [Conexivisphaera sp.]
MRLEDALQLLSAAARPRGWEYAEVAQGIVGRVLAEDVAAPSDLPPAHVCTKDGYLVRHDGEWPGTARIVGECGPGESVAELEAGTAVVAYSGCSVADDRAALLPIEEVAVRGDRVEVGRRPRALENLAPRGSSARAGEAVLGKGRLITPLDVEVLEVLGRRFVRVYARPRVSLISVGSEISLEGRGRTTRYLTVGSIAAALGAEVLNEGVVEDSPTSIAESVRRALDFSDIVVTIGGTGPSARDVTYLALESLGPSATFRGLDVADSAMSGGAVVEGRPILMLPGPRAPALNGAVLLLAPLVLKAGGATAEPHVSTRARMAKPVHMPRRGMLWVRLRGATAEPLQPDYHGIFPSRADGYVLGGPGDLLGEVEVRLPRFL